MSLWKLAHVHVSGSVNYSVIAIVGNNDRYFESDHQDSQGEIPQNRPLSKEGREHLPGNDNVLRITDRICGNCHTKLAVAIFRTTFGPDLPYSKSL